MARTRTFIGVAVSETIRAAAKLMQRTLALSGAEVKWVEPQNLHVTLLYLGEIDDVDLVNACRITARAVAKTPPFTLRVGGVGAFPTPRRPKVLWGGITDGAEALLRLHTAIEAPLLELGSYRQEERGYTPHLTLGRAKGEEDANLLAAELSKHLTWNAGFAVVEEVLVYSTELRRDGMEYTVLGRSPLSGDG